MEQNAGRLALVVLLAVAFLLSLGTSSFVPRDAGLVAALAMMSGVLGLALLAMAVSAAMEQRRQ